MPWSHMRSCGLWSRVRMEEPLAERCDSVKALLASFPVSLCPTTELFYSSIEQGSDTKLLFGTS